MKKFEIDVKGDGYIELSKDAIDLLVRSKQIEDEFKRAKAVRLAIKKAMANANIDVAEINTGEKAYRIKYTPPSTQSRIDSEKVRDVLERAGIAIETVQKDIQISDRITITERELSDE